MTEYSTPELTQLAHDWVLTDLLALPLKPVIVVAGSFEGRVIRLLAERYPDYERIHGFEPQKWAHVRAREKTAGLRDVYLNDYGLLAGKGAKTLPMGEYGTDACSVFATTREKSEGLFRDAVPSMGTLGTIDLFVMNMEGYEYVLIPYMHEFGLLSRIRRLAVQFHTRYAGSSVYAASEHDDAVNILDGEYDCIYDGSPSWVYWVRP